MQKLTLDQLLPHPPLYTYPILISGLPLQSPLILTNLLFSTNFSSIVPNDILTLSETWLSVDTLPSTLQALTPHALLYLSLSLHLWPWRWPCNNLPFLS